MHVRSARDLPDFRLDLLDRWGPDGIFTRAEAAMRAIHGGPVAGALPPGTVEGYVQRRALTEAVLWWVTHDMTALIAHAADTLPETTLTDELLPDDAGLVCFATPLVGTMSDTGETINTDAMVWYRGALYDGRDCVTIASYKFTHAGEDIGNNIVGHGLASLDMWNPTGTATWIFGTDTDRTDKHYDTAEQQASTSEDRRWLAAMWLLADQPLAASTLQRAERPAARRSARRNVTSDVRLQDVRRRPAPTEGEHGEGHVDHDHRWMVAGPNGDGFWRQQAYGPRHSLRRPVWIDPYVAGPADKPLKVRETVKVLRGDS